MGAARRSLRQTPPHIPPPEQPANRQTSNKTYQPNAVVSQNKHSGKINVTDDYFTNLMDKTGPAKQARTGDKCERATNEQVLIVPNARASGCPSPPTQPPTPQRISVWQCSPLKQLLNTVTVLTLESSPSVIVVSIDATRIIRRGCSCRGARAVRTLGISGDPPGDNCNHQEAFRKEQKRPRSLWDLLATMKKDVRRQVLCLLIFSGVLWAFWVGASWGGAPVFDH